MIKYRLDTEIVFINFYSIDCRNVIYDNNWEIAKIN